MAKFRFETDDDDDDRPRRRRREDHDPRRDGGGGVPIGVIVGGAVGAVLLVVGLLVFFLILRKPAGQPEVAKAPDPIVVPAPGQLPVPAPGKLPIPPVFGADLPQSVPKKAGVGVALPADTPGVKYLSFAGGEDGVVGTVGMPLTGTGEVLTVTKVKTGELVGRVAIDQKDAGYGFAVAPGGKFAAVRGSAPFDGDPLILFDMPSKQSYRFTPYSKKGAITNPGLVGFGFPASDKLLTVHETSGFDVWELPGMKRLCGVPGRPPSSIPFVGSNGFSQTPTNFGLSADGKAFAVFDGNGFSFYDTATAARTARTEQFLAPGMLSMNFSGAAFNAAGTRFACLCTLYSPQMAKVLFVWNAADGKRVSAVTVTDNRTGTGFGWWGPDHIAIWQGGQSSALVMAVQSGEIVAKVELETTGSQQAIATSTPGDKLWFAYTSAGFATTATAPRLVSVPAPAALPGKVLNLGPDGPGWR